MRRVKRLDLETKAQKYLTNKQQQANHKLALGLLDTTTEWKNARQTKTMEKVLNVLQTMMGDRQRCMYCLDSHGSDIEHFRPKAKFEKRMFRWRNLLLCCTECGRLKGNAFPVDGKKPLLIDPTKEEPWLHLDFDPTTGNVVALFDSSTNTFSVKGEQTVNTLQLDRREALAAGYKKTFKMLSKIVVDFLNPSTTNIDLISKLCEADEHGLLGWIVFSTGNQFPPFNQLAQNPLLWADLKNSLVNV